ncbi:death-associated protein kinase related-like, partial [Nilaparvata lugens]|uniref:death-associated protein kinase related-like n=1 Tax=Nilaparvata lugens TaxID=108931 RepID=UPI00193E1100
MREVLGFSTAGGGKPLKGETVALEASEKMDISGLGCSIKPSSIPGYLDLTPEQASRLIKTEPLTDYYDVEEEPFARGKYAAVKRCRHKSSGRHFAAKFLRKRRR